MIEVKGLYKSFEGKTVLHNIDAIFRKWKNQPDYRTEWFGKDCTDEMYRRIADTGKRRSAL